MCTPPLRPGDEAMAVSAETMLVEWLAAIHGVTLDGPAALRTWARRDPEGFCAEFAAFARIDPTIAIAEAGCLLGAGIRPDHVVCWTGCAADPCLAEPAAIGGRLAANPGQTSIVCDPPPVWPQPVRPPGVDRDEP